AGVRACDQAKAPVIVASSSSRPVLLAVPLSVMTWSGRETTVPLPRSRKVDSLRVGFPLRMDFLISVIWTAAEDTRWGGAAGCPPALPGHGCGFVDSGGSAADNMRSP